MKTKKVKTLLILLLLATTFGQAQIIDPVKWSTQTKKVSETEYDLILIAQIEESYHLYSQHVPDGGPRPTTFIFEKSEDFKLVGKMKEEKGKTVHDPVFEMRIKSFETEAKFVQRIKIKNKDNFKIVGEIEFMTCNDSQCIFNYDDFEFEI
ncbi:Disulphide bond corrector protein DsbC [Salegentibacter echinorum]|uniref:Disulphide bond corrector protein DsbC n=1 Tax=Salegentibacter echinorum TaxID=1073325 RepID=A0A1M5L426_SALEC|nr:protein-disulfide reductase DsbD domain-containing protein [Salegentibacter echinorum]SHG59768.1 Disulphide bond corrector protein DsbC [Salegentibacter echinorum]